MSVASELDRIKEAYAEDRVRCWACGIPVDQFSGCDCCGAGSAALVPRGCLFVVDERRG